MHFITSNPGSWVIESHVMMGGRGKAGGIKFADRASDGATLARELIGGLGMGTMDAIRTAGGAAANFLDIGGGAQAELVKKSYRLVTDVRKLKRCSSIFSVELRAATKSRAASSMRSPGAICAKCRSSSG